MTNPAPTDGTRWRGYSHADLYKMLHDGPGPTASAEPSRRWGEIASTLTEVSQDLKNALDLTGTGWTGPAAGTAYNRLATTVAWANNAGASAAAMRTSVEDQAGHIAKARAAMPKPSETPAAQPDPTVAPAVQVIQTQTDAEPAEAAASSAEERAVEVMTAYETSTNGTTGALSTFSKPEPLLPNKDMHSGRNDGLINIGLTGAAGLVGGGGGGKYNEGKYDGKSGGKGGGYGGGTYTSNAPWGEPSRQSTPVVSPGRMSGVSADPFFAAGSSNIGGSDESAPRRGNVVGANPAGGGSGGPGGSGGSGGSGMPGGPKSAGFGGLHGPELQQAQQAAAASQAAAGAHPGAHAPMAPGAGGPIGGQEKLAMRRLGMEAIGSSQWFGDNEQPVPGQSPKRRFDLRDSQEEELSESVSILDEEHKLPPGVIGEGGR